MCVCSCLCACTLQLESHLLADCIICKLWHQYVFTSRSTCFSYGELLAYFQRDMDFLFSIFELEGIFVNTLIKCSRKGAAWLLGFSCKKATHALPLFPFLSVSLPPFLSLPLSPSLLLSLLPLGHSHQIIRKPRLPRKTTASGYSCQQLQHEPVPNCNLCETLSHNQSTHHPLTHRNCQR